MENDVKNVETQEVQFNANDYIANLNALRNNMVPKDEYQKVVEDNKNLMNALANGTGGVYEDEDEEEEKVVDVDALRKTLFNANSDVSDLEYITCAVQLRDYILETEEKDIFLPNNPSYQFKDSDAMTTHRIAEVFKECIEAADGNNDVFKAQLQARVDFPRLR